MCKALFSSLSALVIEASKSNNSLRHLYELNKSPCELNKSPCETRFDVSIITKMLLISNAEVIDCQLQYMGKQVLMIKFELL